RESHPKGGQASVMRISLLGGVMLASAVGLPEGPISPTGAVLYPDLQVVIPQHLALRTTPDQELLYFTNGIANRGAGPLQLRPDPETTTETPPAVQELFDARGRVVERRVVGVFVYSADHAHWHLADVARFELRIALDGGKQGRWGDVVRELDKETMCLLDFYKL